ncbi:MAG TPA: translocation/assembly module TamB domain-containing protein [Vicinamibacterales bacterium]
MAKALVGITAFVLIVTAIAIGVVETGWAKEGLRDLIVGQANQYLTATLAIGRLEGSLFRGIELGDVNLSRNGQTLIHIDEISLSYALRELFDRGVTIRRVRLTHPVVVGARTTDGTWDLAALVKRDSSEAGRTGPGRPITVQSIEVVNGHVSLRSPLDFGAAHVPTDFDALNASFSFAYYPVHWTLTFDRASWVGSAPELSVNPLTGAFGRGSNGWFFQKFAVHTARSAFTLDGTVNNAVKPTQLDLQVRADRFAFQEWAGVIHGLQRIDVETSFDVSLKGPLSQLATDLRLRGNGGSVTGKLTLDTTVPGWHGRGAVDVARLNLARWISQPDRPSDITGRVTFDLALELGNHFPRGIFSFEGAHAMYMDYAGDQVRARGQLTADAALITHADALAYGARVSMDNSSIGLAEPYPFHFTGTATSVDLRRVPAAVPVPHVESLLAFDYDVAGRFSEPFIAGQAKFAGSTFLGALIGSGTTGTIDTSEQPLHYTGSGDITNVDLHHFGEGLGVDWMQAPRYAGTISGRFNVDGRGVDRASLALTGGGHLTSANLFGGALSDAQVSIAIEDGTLRASYDGAFTQIDPSIPFEEPRIAARLTGTGHVTAVVRELLRRDVTLADYGVDGAMTLQPFVFHDVALESGQIDAELASSTLNVRRLDLVGRSITGTGRGTVALTDDRETNFDYDIQSADLERLRALTAIEAAGEVATKGHVSGRWTVLRAVGDATLDRLAAYDVTALTTTGHYDIVLPSLNMADVTATISARGTSLTIAGQALAEAAGNLSLAAERLRFDVQLAHSRDRHGAIAGDVALHLDTRQVDLNALTVTVGSARWRLIDGRPAATVAWSDDELSITGAEFDGSNDQKITVAGSWRTDGGGALQVTATNVFLDSLQAAFEQPTLYGGALDLDTTISGTRKAPRVVGTVTVNHGRVQRLSYQKLTVRFTYANEIFDVSGRLDQAPDVWMTAVGTIPMGLFRSDLPERAMDVTIESSSISLGLVQGLTDLVSDVTGEAKINVKAIGTSRDPHMTGTVAITNGGFLLTSTGSHYKNIRAAMTLAADQIRVDSLHIEDSSGRPLDVHGSLGTHELSVGDLEIEATASRFEVMRNGLGRVNLDASLRLRGRLEAPRIAGELTIAANSTVRVDEILQRALFQPYSTEASTATDVDAVRALNPWDRLGLDIQLHVPGTLRLTGDNVQISSNTPIGLGEVNIKTTGDLYLYKDPGGQLSVTGSFDSLSGTYAFQGRRFDVDPASSINFRGDLNPGLYVTVTRTISAVQARVSILGSLDEPELRLASTPPLDESDILSLIVFNMATNQLSGAQQQQLLVRAGTLAAGFLASPLLSALEKEIGFGMLEIDPNGDNGTGPRVTIGNEIAPGLVARFSRQFGTDEYDEATVEYALSRVLRLRANYSDAQSTTGFAAFRRVEHTGLDLIFFFSF